MRLLISERRSSTLFAESEAILVTRRSLCDKSFNLRISASSSSLIVERDAIVLSLLGLFVFFDTSLMLDCGFSGFAAPAQPPYFNIKLRSWFTVSRAKIGALVDVDTTGSIILLSSLF